MTVRDSLKAAVESAKNSIASPVIKKAIKNAVPTFHDPEEINKEASRAPEMVEANV